MACKKDSLWFAVVSSSSSIDNWFAIESANTLHFSHLWKGIHKVCVKNKVAWDCFLNSVSMSLGDGTRTRFWLDRWLNEPLFSIFPSLFKISRNKHALIVTVFDQQLSHFGNFEWARRLRVGEQEQLSQLQNLLPRLDGLQDEADRFLWLKSTEFTVASMAKLFTSALHSSQLSSHSSFTFLAAAVWKEFLPPRLQFFVWLMDRDRISSNVTLVRRGILNHEQISCSICSMEESSIHIVLHCKFAWSFWNSMLSNSNVVWVTPFSLDSFFMQWMALATGRYLSRPNL
ncbi:uncharacterized protein LOC130015100 [Mercurialis annua]|uniref:uncharacterized protein LOC130015100 n=1 Tax=Mercurialis annua TaxID=3986 RepID=UPI0024ACA87F|nr:uncharacterized protein LOC130015100 [Mercurialis annua]